MSWLAGCTAGWPVTQRSASKSTRPPPSIITGRLINSTEIRFLPSIPPDPFPPAPVASNHISHACCGGNLVSLVCMVTMIVVCACCRGAALTMMTLSGLVLSCRDLFLFRLTGSVVGDCLPVFSSWLAEVRLPAHRVLFCLLLRALWYLSPTYLYYTKLVPCTALYHPSNPPPPKTADLATFCATYIPSHLTSPLLSVTSLLSGGLRYLLPPQNRGAPYTSSLTPCAFSSRSHAVPIKSRPPKHPQALLHTRGTTRRTLISFATPHRVPLTRSIASATSPPPRQSAQTAATV